MPRRVFPTSRPTGSRDEDLPQKWAAKVEDARRARQSYERAVARYPSGPLRDRLEALEAGFEASVGRCREVAQWGAEAEAARSELDPSAVGRAARSAGKHGRHAAAAQREVMARLDTVTEEAKARLVVINGRLDEAVGRAVEIAGNASTESGLGLGATEVATRLESLQAALEEVDGLGSEQPRPATGQGSRRGSTG